MSGWLAGIVWQSNLPRRLKPVAAALADIANDDGTSIEPSIAYVAWLLGDSGDEGALDPSAPVPGERAIQSAIAELRAMGVLELVAPGRGGRGEAGLPAQYRMVREKLPARRSWQVERAARKALRIASRVAEKGADPCEKGATAEPVAPVIGAESAPFIDEKGADPGSKRVQETDEKGADPGSKRVQLSTKRVQPTAPDPSVIRPVEPSDPPGRSVMADHFVEPDEETVQEFEAIFGERGRFVALQVLNSPEYLEATSQRAYLEAWLAGRRHMTTWRAS